MAHDRSAFMGSWQLVDWRIEYPDGAVTRPFGDAPFGYILYSDDGIMAAAIARSERERFDITNARNASPTQKSAAFDSYFHYAGPWHIDGEDVVHSVTMSLAPNMTGTEQRRHAVFDGKGGLTLSAVENSASGVSRHHILQWTKRAG